MRLWKEILTTIEGLLVPPLSDRPTEMRPLSEKELDVVYKWLGVSLRGQPLAIRLMLDDSVQLTPVRSTSSVPGQLLPRWRRRSPARGFAEYQVPR